MGLLFWFRHFVQISILGDSHLSNQYMQNLLQDPDSYLIDYWWFNLIIPAEDYKPFNADPTYLAKLNEYGRLLVEDKKADLKNLAYLLTH